jgi:hypothetical protein
VNMLTSVTIRWARNPPAVSLRFPGPGSSSQGKSGPKIRPKGVVDGKRVNIPVPISYVLAMEGRRRVDQPHDG